MPEITLHVPDAMPVALRVSRERLGGELLLAAAVKLYEAGRLSSGAAAELAGLPKPVFLQMLGEFGVATFRQNAEELREELANA
jgi:predicted HTH domain antitoxin